MGGKEGLEGLWAAPRPTTQIVAAKLSQDEEREKIGLGQRLGQKEWGKKEKGKGRKKGGRRGEEEREKKR